MKWQNKCINIDHSPLQKNVVVIGNISSLQTTLYVIWSISDQTKSDTENFGHLIAVVYILMPLHRFFSAFLAPHPPISWHMGIPSVKTEVYLLTPIQQE